MNLYEGSTDRPKFQHCHVSVTLSTLYTTMCAWWNKNTFTFQKLYQISDEKLPTWGFLNIQDFLWRVHLQFNTWWGQVGHMTSSHSPQWWVDLNLEVHNSKWCVNLQNLWNVRYFHLVFQAEQRSSQYVWISWRIFYYTLCTFILYIGFLVGCILVAKTAESIDYCLRFEIFVMPEMRGNATK